MHSFISQGVGTFVQKDKIMKYIYIFLLFGLVGLFTSCGDDDVNDGNLIHYDGDNFNAPLFDPGNVETAIYLPSSILNNYIGRQIEYVDFYLYDTPDNSEIVIYSESGPSQPGVDFYRQTLGELRSDRWNSHVLSSPLDIDGSPLWISFRFNNAQAKQTIGCDAGPRDTRGGDWTYYASDNEWRSFQDRTSESINWNIRVGVSD